MRTLSIKGLGNGVGTSTLKGKTTESTSNSTYSVVMNNIKLTLKRQLAPTVSKIGKSYVFID